MKEELAVVDMNFRRLMSLFLSVMIVYSAYALAIVIAPISFYQKGIAIFFTAAPVGLFVYHIWNKMKLLTEQVKQI